MVIRILNLGICIVSHAPQFPTFLRRETTESNVSSPLTCVLFLNSWNDPTFFQDTLPAFFQLTQLYKRLPASTGGYPVLSMSDL